MLASLHDFLNLTINGYHLGDVFWNLTLVLLTYYLFFAVQYAIKKSKKTWRAWLFWPIFAVWYLFLPNTLYLVTDVRHLLDYCPRNSYLDVCLHGAWMIFFFFIYALIGWLTFYHLMEKMFELLETNYGKIIAKIFRHFSLIIMPLAVLLGLLNRLNSWQIFTAPSVVTHNILAYFTQWRYLQQWLSIVLIVYLMYYATKLMIHYLLKNHK
ncbi:MAG TPA: DUF1361 domain-containing protein [bacterium]|nr:DUF1361 domain-containing protein [bacterium]